MNKAAFFEYGVNLSQLVSRSLDLPWMKVPHVQPHLCPPLEWMRMLQMDFVNMLQMQVFFLVSCSEAGKLRKPHSGGEWPLQEPGDRVWHGDSS